MQSPYENLIRVIDLILQKMELETDKNSFRINLSDVPTHSIEERQELIVFLDNLKKNGVLYELERFTIGSPNSPSSSLFRSMFMVKPNKIKLLEERQRLINFDQSQSVKQSAKSSSEKQGAIEKLEIVKPKMGSRFKIVVNGDYKNLILVDKTKPSWDLLFRIAEEEFIDAENHKNAIDYFNFNKKCRLYAKTGYSVTKILKVEGGYISPAIEIEIITEKAFQQRANKS